MNEAYGDDGHAEARGDGRADTKNELNATVLGSAVQARSVRDIQFNFGSGTPPLVPRQLLPPPAHFIGRDKELSKLRHITTDQHLTGPTRIAVITGAGGIGKTSLALSLLHGVRDRYKAGQLYADLGGFSTDGPADPDDVLGRFLRSLGVRPGDVPPDHHERAGLFRSLTDSQPIAILLDNAISAAQVRALLPGAGPNFVVVTSRRRIAGLKLDGAEFTDLPPLDEEAAVELLGRIMDDDRTASEPQAALNLVHMCGRLPIAVCASAARLAPRPYWSIGRLVDELANERRRIAALSVEEDVSVRAVFDISYKALSLEAARFYRRLGLLPVTEFRTGLAIAATGVDAADASDLLDGLVDTNLLEEIGNDRFRYHDLLRLHARSQAEADPPEQRMAVVERSIDWYVRSATAADLLILPQRWHLSPCYDEPPAPPVPMDTSVEAIAWLESELTNIVAILRWGADNHQDDSGWQLCEALWGLFVYRKHHSVWIESHLIGLECAKAAGDAVAEARMHVQLGSAYRSTRQFDQALSHFNEALTLERGARHRLGEGSALDQLGVVMLRLERYDEAIDYFSASRAIHEEVDVPRGVALMDLNIGQALSGAGRHSDALAQFERARRGFHAIADSHNEARTLTAIAGTHIHAGHLGDAAPALDRSLTILRKLGATYEQAHAHVQLADLAEQRDDTDAVRSHLQEAFALFTKVGASQAEQTRARLEDMEVRLDSSAEPDRRDLPEA